MIDAVPVALAAGAVSVPLLRDSADAAQAVMVLAHGAGAGPDHPFLAGFARGCANAGLEVVRFPFPYIVAGRRLPGTAADAVETWAAVMQAVTATHPDLPVVAAGKSYGGRMASVAAAQGRIDPALLVYLGYPLHPPGRPDRPRVEHLPGVTGPQLFVSGTRDPFVEPVADLEAAVSTCVDAEIVWVEGGRHSFEVAGSRREPEVVGAELAAVIAPRCLARVGA
ncbi:alpha/beta family hydrolase [Microbacterium sp. cf332]|uniref:alpha/beta hydrolase family protein n=1 Tax=Microbacterium sp. cf332 TaxID=1761804 RepID=UPI00088B9882|nr:alpha/beta family hydrolase [Microbacterium sp. cf332]SDQ06941.1 hypothetical protein SAMN04487847_0167 [Microbacterium sp. cf332]